MPPRGQKRAAAEDGEGRTTRSKVAKTESTSNGKTGAKGGKKGPKASMGATAFKAKALPLHVNLTHTPPVLADGAVDVAQVDPGFIGSTTLTPSSFNTGSYGWKGSKRITVELENSESGQKEKVQVMLTINATVLGSKNAPDDEAETAEAAEQPVAEGEEKVDAPESAPKDPEPSKEEEKTASAGEEAAVEQASS